MYIFYNERPTSARIWKQTVQRWTSRIRSIRPTYNLLIIYVCDSAAPVHNTNVRKFINCFPLHQNTIILLYLYHNIKHYFITGRINNHYIIIYTIIQLYYADMSIYMMTAENNGCNINNTKSSLDNNQIWIKFDLYYYSFILLLQ